MSNLKNIYADVLIITVTKVGSRAVLDSFEKATGNKAINISVEGRVYRNLGEINGTNVFMPLSEMSAGGLGAAQQAVQKGIGALNPYAVISDGGGSIYMAGIANYVTLFAC